MSPPAEKLADERQRRKAKKKIDLSLMIFLHLGPRRLSSRGCTTPRELHLHKMVHVLTLGMFAIMVLIFVSGWSEIWRDTVQLLHIYR